MYYCYFCERYLLDSRKKYSTTRQQEHEIEAEANYSRLVNIATKMVRKECKVVKSFECQKIVRKIKTIRADDITTSGKTERKPSSEEENDEAIISPTNGNTDILVSISNGTYNANDNKAQCKIAKLEEKLRFTKEFDLDEVVGVCLTRIGLRQKPKSEVQIVETNEEHLLENASLTSRDSKCGIDDKINSVSGKNKTSFYSHDVIDCYLNLKIGAQNSILLFSNNFYFRNNQMTES